MLQNYTTTGSPAGQAIALPGNKVILVLLASLSLSFAVYTALINRTVQSANVANTSTPAPTPDPFSTFNDAPPGELRTDSAATVVSKALYFRSLLTTTQIATLEQTYTASLARKWSNLPCGSGCRNGLVFSSLTAAQMGAVLALIKAAAGTTAGQGFDQFSQIRLAEETLQATAGGTTYDSLNYYISFLNTPTITGTWMLQFGGHHYAANIAFNAGKVVGTTPTFEGVEPKTFTVNSVTYAPLNPEHDTLANMLASLTTAQLATAKLSSTFSDVTMAPGETNGNTNTFPATKQGLVASGLTTAQKSLIIAAIKTYTQDTDDSSGAFLQTAYANEIDATYIGWTGSGTSGTASTFLNANTNYVRIDGPGVWIEFVCQSGVVFPSQIHYHSVYRDHYRDYGTDLTRTTLPLKLLSFNAFNQNNYPTITWTISQAENVDHFEVDYSSDPASGFTAVGKVQAINTADTKSYTFTDNISATESKSYYRLKMVEKDGQIEYSSIVSIKNNSSKTGISVYPNPASDVITVLPAESLNNAVIKITSNLGSVVIKSAGLTGSKADVNISKLPPGLYFIQLQNNGTISSSKFVKQGGN